MSTDAIKKIVLTNADSWLGCCTACHLAQQLEEKCKGVELVCLAQKPEVLEKLKKFKNVRIEKIDYNDETSLDKALEGGVSCAILIPEDDENRVKYAKCALSALKKAGSKGSIMISLQGADESSDLKALQSYREIEQEVEQCRKYLILRKSTLDQCFLFWGNIVRERAEFPITFSKECEMVPLDVRDLACAIEEIVVHHCHHGHHHGHHGHHDNTLEASPSQVQQQQQQQDEDEDEDDGSFGAHKNKTYTLTGPQTWTLNCIVKDLSEITGEQIEIKEVDREDLKKYLESLNELEGRSENIDPDWCQRLLDSGLDNRNHSRRDGDNGHDHDHDGDHIAPNEALINVILDELEFIGQGNAGSVSGDLEKIVGRPGKSIKDFLLKEKDTFKPERD